MLMTSHLYKCAVLQAYNMKQPVELPQEYDAMPDLLERRCHPIQSREIMC